MITPCSIHELREAVLSAPQVIAVGGETKPRLSAVDALRISTRSLNGIVEYEPSEFTFTALAGTKVSEIIATLAESGQYLPFDPMLVEAGSTIGGVVASGLSGPGRFRFGGVRDFILGVSFVDGTGRLLRLGGRVVKNAAGFDVPKFLVGSLGRFGVIAEVTFKVFPKPPLELTLRVPFEQASLERAARSRWECEALDILPGGETLLIRLAGPDRSVHSLAAEITSQLGGHLADHAVWDELREFRWVPRDAPLIKTPIVVSQVAAFHHGHVSCAGSVAYSAQPVDHGLALWGQTSLWMGKREVTSVESAVKLALDPQNRFPSLDD